MYFTYLYIWILLKNSIYDSTGKLVKSISNICDSSVIINKDYLENGLYLFKLESENIVLDGKFIIK